ncbi:uncharacterized protein [Typha latifolia]|uniref:uncharacterized protein isoform X3 n=1 Tax=Typha latifolia TaxID=4733 RepID=UPI003C3042DC
MVLIIPFPFPSTKSLLPFRNPNRTSITRRPTCPMSANLPRFSALPHHPHQNRTGLSNPLARGDLGRTITKIQASEISRDVMGVAKWSETAMLVIDMQNDYILPESPLCVAGGDAIVPSVIRAVQVARERGILVIWVVREHDHLGRDVEQFRRHFYTDGKGAAVKASKGAELVDGLLIEERDYKLVKTRFSAFFATHLGLLLQNCGINKLVVAGNKCKEWREGDGDPHYCEMTLKEPIFFLDKILLATVHFLFPLHSKFIYFFITILRSSL